MQSAPGVRYIKPLKGSCSVKILESIENYYQSFKENRNEKGEKRMFRHFIAIKTFEHQIDCFCPDGIHADVLTIHRGDIIELINERKFMFEKGWYFLIRLNNQCDFHIALEDLEQYYLNERLLSMIDIELTLNYLQFKINQALDTGDEESFLNFTKKLKESYDLKVKLEQYAHNVAV